MKALVTGGAGFIGSHLAETLCRRGAQVVIIDNLSTGDMVNLAWKRPGDALDFIQGDVGDETLLCKVLPGCDWVFHEAALPSVPWSVAEPVLSNAQNLDATLKLLVAARDAKVRRFVFASSSAIYGENPVSPKREDLPPQPLSPYGLQKYASETYGRMFHALYGFESVGLRYFNVFGPRQAFNSPYSGVIAKFCTVMLQGQRPVIFGDGLQSRDFIYVANVVAANLLAAEGPSERVAGQVFNVANGQSITLLDLVAELNRLTGQDLAPRFEAPRVGDVRSSQADISALVQATGYQVDVSWQVGLRHTLDFYRRS